MRLDAAEVAERADGFRELIAAHAGRPVKIVAVTKRFGPEAVKAALAAGIVDIGENYAQELVSKADLVGDVQPRPRWHFIGHVQRNKVRLVADLVVMWHSVDSAKLGREIAKRSPGASILVQVNATASESQSGVPAADVPELVGQLRDLDLDVQGLMTIGAADDLSATEELFHRVRRIADDLGLPECSMGMSGDVKAALIAGSTMIRVGTGLFGPRPTLPAS